MDNYHAVLVHKVWGNGTSLLKRTIKNRLAEQLACLAPKITGGADYFTNDYLPLLTLLGFTADISGAEVKSFKSRFFG